MILKSKKNFWRNANIEPGFLEGFLLITVIVMSMAISW